MRAPAWLIPLLLALPAVAADPAPTPAPAPPTGLTARLEVKGRYYRAGEPVEVRVVIDNLTSGPIPNTSGVPLAAGLMLEMPDGSLKPAAARPFDPATQPKVFAAGSSSMQILDMVPLFPPLTQPGSYKLHFKSGAIEASAVDLVVAPPYDPDLHYQATLRTDFGDIVFDLLEQVAPDHVRNFVDLARRGFYDNTHFFLVAKGEVVAGGDPKGDGSGGPGYDLPPELSTLPHERGTLASARGGAFAGFDNGSQFIIDLRRRDDWDGNFSIFGKMVSGEEALSAIENVATSGQNMRPFFRPVKDVVLRSVIIEGKPRAAKTPAAAPSKP
jgi:peptidyl-prolyl cis-trans isomerase B (cyclophilin B)